MGRNGDTKLARFHRRRITTDLFEDLRGQVSVLHDGEGEICRESRVSS
jgi:hypothetical protein